MELSGSYILFKKLLKINKNNVTLHDTIMLDIKTNHPSTNNVLWQGSSTDSCPRAWLWVRKPCSLGIIRQMKSYMKSQEIECNIFLPGVNAHPLLFIDKSFISFSLMLLLEKLNSSTRIAGGVSIFGFNAHVLENSSDISLLLPSWIEAPLAEIGKRQNYHKDL